MKKKGFCLPKNIKLPDKEAFCNVAAEVKAGKLFIHLLSRGTYSMQIEIGKGFIYRTPSSHYRYSNEVYEYTYELSASTLWYHTNGYPVRFIGDAKNIIEAFTGISPDLDFDSFIKLLSKKYVKGEKAYQNCLKETQEREQLFSTLPAEPDDLTEYATNCALRHSTYIVSTRSLTRKSKRDFYCTHCHNKFTDYPQKYGTPMTCPNCHKTSEVRYGRYFHPNDESNFIMFKVANDGKGIFARYYLCRRDYRNSYRNVKTELCELGRYYFAPGKSRLWTRSEHCQSCQNQWFTDCQTWYKRGMFFFQCNNFYNGYFHNKEEILKVFPHCQLDEFHRRFITGNKLQCNLFPFIAGYIDKYTKAPMLEYFIKSKLDNFVKEYLGDAPINSKVNWRGKKPESIFGLSREIVKKYIFKHIIEDSAALEYAKALHNRGKFNEENLGLMDSMRKHLSAYEFVQFLSEFNKNDIDLIKSMKYVLAQKKRIERYTQKMTTLSYVISDYKDYLQMAGKLQYNLQDDYFRYPRYLKKAHDDVQKLIQVKTDKALDDKIKKQVRKLMKYCFEQDGLILKPFSSSKDISNEGKKQSICIANYITRYADGETGLFFIRKKSDPKTPFYAVEIKKGQILQVRGNHNKPATPEVEAFIGAFREQKLTVHKKPKKAVEEIRVRVAV